MPISVLVTSDQFNSLVQQLEARREIVLTQMDSGRGTIQTPDVSLLYYFAPPNLTVTVAGRHSFKAKMSPEDIIESRVRDMIERAITIH